MGLTWLLRDTYHRERRRWEDVLRADMDKELDSWSQQAAAGVAPAPPVLRWRKSWSSKAMIPGGNVIEVWAPLG